MQQKLLKFTNGINGKNLHDTITLKKTISKFVFKYEKSWPIASYISVIKCGIEKAVSSAIYNYSYVRDFTWYIKFLCWSSFRRIYWGEYWRTVVYFWLQVKGKDPDRIWRSDLTERRFEVRRFYFLYWQLPERWLDGVQSVGNFKDRVPNVYTTKMSESVIRKERRTKTSVRVSMQHSRSSKVGKIFGITWVKSLLAREVNNLFFLLSAEKFPKKKLRLWYL